MTLQIREVTTKKDLLKWIRFPNELYYNSENFVPFLDLNPRKVPVRLFISNSVNSSTDKSLPANLPIEK